MVLFNSVTGIFALGLLIIVITALGAMGADIWRLNKRYAHLEYPAITQADFDHIIARTRGYAIAEGAVCPSGNAHDRRIRRRLECRKLRYIGGSDWF